MLERTFGTHSHQRHAPCAASLTTDWLTHSAARPPNWPAKHREGEEGSSAGGGVGVRGGEPARRHASERARALGFGRRRDALLVAAAGRARRREAGAEVRRPSPRLRVSSATSATRTAPVPPSRTAHTPWQQRGSVTFKLVKDMAVKGRGYRSSPLKVKCKHYHFWRMTLLLWSSPFCPSEIEQARKLLHNFITDRKSRTVGWKLKGVYTPSVCRLRIELQSIVGLRECNQLPYITTDFVRL